MDFASTYNKTSFDVDTKDFKYIKLSELYKQYGKEKTYKIDAVYINKSKLGFSPLFVVSDLKIMVNLPQHLTDTVRQILADLDAVDTIKSGKVAFTIYEYSSKQKQLCYSIKFVNL